jgi:hypothetical protein
MFGLPIITWKFVITDQVHTYRFSEDKIIMNKKLYPTNSAGKNLLPLALLIGALLITACSPAAAVPATGKSSTENNTAPTSITAPLIIATTVPMATTSSDANTSTSNPKCDALFLANYNIGIALATMVNLTANTNYTAYTTPNTPFYLDFKKIRSSLDTLATLPDPSAADALIVGKPSEAITYFHQLVDLAETDVKNQGKPFVDTSPSGVKLIGIDTPWEQHAAVFGVAMENVCKNYTAPSYLFSGTPVATVDPQAGQANDSLMSTMAAADVSMQATINAAETAYPEPTETPAP